MSTKSYTKAIGCKGRNGFFEYHTHNVFSWKIGLARVVILDIFSKQKGKEAPLVIGGPQDEMIALFESILAGARKEPS